MSNDTTTLFFDTIAARTDKAVCVMVETEWAVDGGTGDVAIGGKKVWLPLSQIKLDEASNAADLPTWLARKKGVYDLTTG